MMASRRLGLWAGLAVTAVGAVGLVIDLAGTPLDPTDDQLVSQELVSENGGKPQPDINYCDSFHALTG